MRLLGTNPPSAGFDLDLLLNAGRAAAAGASPYDPSMLAGAAPAAERLFYSYPPPVAQAMALVAAVPRQVVFAAWTALAVAALAIVAARLAERYAPTIRPAAVALVTLALIPLMFPFAIGLLFGNLDIFFPAAYGFLLVCLAGAGSTAALTAAGGTVGLAIVGKLGPSPIGLWLLARSPSSSAVRRATLAAIAVGIAVVALSIAIGGLQPWLDYGVVLRSGTGSDLVDPRNAAPAAQIALLLGGGPGGESLARSLQVPVSTGAVLVTILAAVRVRDLVESLAWSVVATFVILPITWYHYPAALIPFALVAVLRTIGDPVGGARVRWFVLGAGVTAALAITWLPLLYVAVGLTLAAIRRSADRGPNAPESSRARARA
jgi:hypothetical protein